MKRWITKFPKAGESPYETRIEVRFYERITEREKLSEYLEQAGFQLEWDEKSNLLMGRHTTADPTKAEGAVRILGKNGFTEPKTDRYTTATPSQTSSC